MFADLLVRRADDGFRRIALPAVSRRALVLAAAGAIWPIVSTRAQPGALSSWALREAGARVHAYSSTWSGAAWSVENLVPGREDFDARGEPLTELVWCSADGAPFPHWAVIDLGQRRWITTFVFGNALDEEPQYPGISARHLELWLGDSADGLRKVAAFQLERNRNGQAVRIEPAQARFVKLQVASNWGHPTWTELAAPLVFDDGSRPFDLAAQLRANGRVDLYGLYFDFGSAALRAESGPTLAAIVEFHRAQRTQRLLVEGHTDDVGAAASNLALSQRRAAAVTAELVRLGVPAALLRAEGRGSAVPVADNATIAGRARNRRVSVVLV